MFYFLKDRKHFETLYADDSTNLIQKTLGRCVNETNKQNAIICKPTVFTTNVLQSAPEPMCWSIKYNHVFLKVVNPAPSLLENDWAFQGCSCYTIMILSLFTFHSILLPLSQLVWNMSPASHMNIQIIFSKIICVYEVKNLIVISSRHPVHSRASPLGAVGTGKTTVVQKIKIV